MCLESLWVCMGVISQELLSLAVLVLKTLCKLQLTLIFHLISVVVPKLFLVSSSWCFPSVLSSGKSSAAEGDCCFQAKPALI